MIKEHGNESGQYNKFTATALTADFVFIWFDSLRPINNLSVKQGRVFLGCPSTKLG